MTVEPFNNSEDSSDYESPSTSTLQNRRSIFKPRGLRNLGNTCYLNSVIQCLFSTESLREYLITKQYIRDIASDFKGNLIKSFSDLIIDMCQSDDPNGVTYIASFKGQFQRYAPRFIGNSQHDSQECLRYLLEGLHEDVNKGRKNSKGYIMELPDDMPINDKARECWRLYRQAENSKIVDIFGGQLRQDVNFPVCGHQSTTFEVFWDLSLSFPKRRESSNSVQLMECLENFMKEEVLEESEKVLCKKCNVLRKCVKRYSIQKFPPVLVLHLKRFSPNDRFRTKLNTSVVFPTRGLDLSRFTESNINKNNTTYNLYAVSNHSGTPLSGHYTAMCRQQLTNRWYYLNDSSVVPVSADQFRMDQVYILFYEQISVKKKTKL